MEPFSVHPSNSDSVFMSQQQSYNGVGMGMGMDMSMDMDMEMEMDMGPLANKTASALGNIANNNNGNNNNAAVTRNSRTQQPLQQQLMHTMSASTHQQYQGSGRTPQEQFISKSAPNKQNQQLLGNPDQWNTQQHPNIQSHESISQINPNNSNNINAMNPNYNLSIPSQAPMPVTGERNNKVTGNHVEMLKMKQTGQPYGNIQLKSDSMNPNSDASRMSASNSPNKSSTQFSNNSNIINSSTFNKQHLSLNERLAMDASNNTSSPSSIIPSPIDAKFSQNVHRSVPINSKADTRYVQQTANLVHPASSHGQGQGQGQGPEMFNNSKISATASFPNNQTNINPSPAASKQVNSRLPQQQQQPNLDVSVYSNMNSRVPLAQQKLPPTPQPRSAPMSVSNSMSNQLPSQPVHPASCDNDMMANKPQSVMFLQPQQQPPHSQFQPNLNNIPYQQNPDLTDEVKKHLSNISTVRYLTFNDVITCRHEKPNLPYLKRIISEFFTPDATFEVTLKLGDDFRNYQLSHHLLPMLYYKYLENVQMFEVSQKFINVEVFPEGNTVLETDHYSIKCVFDDGSYCNHFGSLTIEMDKDLKFKHFHITTDYNVHGIEFAALEKFMNDFIYIYSKQPSMPLISSNHVKSYFTSINNLTKFGFKDGFLRLLLISDVMSLTKPLIDLYKSEDFKSPFEAMECFNKLNTERLNQLDPNNGKPTKSLNSTSTTSSLNHHINASNSNLNHNRQSEFNGISFPNEDVNINNRSIEQNIYMFDPSNPGNREMLQKRQQEHQQAQQLQFYNQNKTSYQNNSDTSHYLPPQNPPNYQHMADVNFKTTIPNQSRSHRGSIIGINSHDVSGIEGLGGHSNAILGKGNPPLKRSVGEISGASQIVTKKAHKKINLQPPPSPNKRRIMDQNTVNTG